MSKKTNRINKIEKANNTFTIPNQLTILRLVLTAIFVATKEINMPWSLTIATIAFLIAVLTDYLDGVIARRLKCETDFGKLMDPLADKVLVCAALILLTWSHDIPAWATIILITRDFLITGLRQVAASQKVVLAADPFGKAKTATQMIMIIFFLLRDNLAELLNITNWNEYQIVLSTGYILIATSLLLSIFSGWNYTHKYWNTIVQSK